MTRIQVLQARVAELEEVVSNCTCKGNGDSSAKASGSRDGCEVKAKVGEEARHTRDKADATSSLKEGSTQGELPITTTTTNKGKETAGAKNRLVQDGAWKCIGGSRFWRPAKFDKSSNSKRSDHDEGVWMMRGNSKVWRKKSEYAGQEWKTVTGHTKRGASHPSFELKLSNQFSTLESEDVEEVRNLVVGDSRVRPLRHTFCSRKDRCIVRPGAGVAQVTKAVDEELQKCSPEVILVQVGVNDVGRRCSEKTLKDYSCLLQRLQEARKPVIVTGILPRRWATSEWYSRAMGMNSRVGKICAEMGLNFVDAWDKFYGNSRFFGMDGLHLSYEGAKALSSAYQHSIQGNC